MTSKPPADPFTFFRDMVTQWENSTNELGNKLMGTPEAAQMMQAGTAAAIKAQQATNEAMAKALAAANMPSKGDIEALGARLVAIEAQLARIEARLSGTAPTPSTGPKRTRKPPEKAQ